MQYEDRLVHAVAADGQLRCLAAVTTDLVGEACRRHGTFPTASAAFGRALTGGLLLGGGVKDLEKIVVHFHCNGPIGNIIVQADAEGRVRGYVTNPQADLVNGNARGKLDVRAVVGGGMLYVYREAGFEIGLMKEPYRGMVPIVSGEIGEDIAHYLVQSEQINSAVGIGVLMEMEEGTSEASLTSVGRALDLMRVAAAGGYIIQVMPSAEEGLVNHLEEVISKAPSPTEMISRGLKPIEMLHTLLGEIEVTVLEERAVRFECQCSRPRALQIISALGREEVQDMLAKDDGAEFICHFCNETYQITGDELRGLIEGEEKEIDS
jgi:molecular chaperone Hsp33